MPLYINTNVISLATQKQFGRTQRVLNKSLERMSTGEAINHAADSPSGLSISEGLKADFRSLAQARRNANDGLSLMQTMEGGLEQLSGMLIRMRELAVQSANGTISSNQRLEIQTDYEATIEMWNQIKDTTRFNGMNLLPVGGHPPSETPSFEFQVGADGELDDRLRFDWGNYDSATIVGGVTTSVSTIAEARSALGAIDAALSELSAARSEIGAMHHELSVTMADLETAVENLTDANSRIRDVDFASETAELTKTQVIIQAGVSIMAQANQSPMVALTLIS